MPKPTFTPVDDKARLRLPPPPGRAKTARKDPPTKHVSPTADELVQILETVSKRYVKRADPKVERGKIAASKQERVKESRTVGVKNAAPGAAELVGVLERASLRFTKKAVPKSESGTFPEPRKHDVKEIRSKTIRPSKRAFVIKKSNVTQVRDHVQPPSTKIGLKKSTPKSIEVVKVAASIKREEIVSAYVSTPSAPTTKRKSVYKRSATGRTSPATVKPAKASGTEKKSSDSSETTSDAMPSGYNAPDILVDPRCLPGSVYVTEKRPSPSTKLRKKSLFVQEYKKVGHHPRISPGHIQTAPAPVVPAPQSKPSRRKRCVIAIIVVIALVVVLIIVIVVVLYLKAKKKL